MKPVNNTAFTDRMNPFSAALLFSSALLIASSATADWPQWRGPNRSGYAESGSLLTELPADGLQSVWRFPALQGGTSGGWSSPVISGNHVFVYSHSKTKNEGTNLGEAKFPWLPESKRTGMTDKEYREYEVKRRDENEQRAKAYKFNERMLCLDLATGEVVWDRNEESIYTRFTQSSTPCIANGKILVLTPERTAKCFDAATGNTLWSQRLPGDFRDEFYASSFIVASSGTASVAIVACGPLFGLNIDDGEILWKGAGESDYQSHSCPVIWKAGDTAIAIANTSGGRTQAYRVKDGSKLWEVRSGGGNATPIVAGDKLLTYGSSRKSGLTAFQLDPAAPETAPEQAWRFQRAADSGSTPVVIGDHVFVQGEKRVAKVNLADGSSVWQTTLSISTPKYTSMIAAGDQLFYSWEGLLAFQADGDDFKMVYDAEIDSKGRLIRGDDLRRLLKLDEVKAGDGGLAESEKIWQKEAIKSGPLGCSTPAFSDGRMVLRLRDAVICFDLRR